MVHVWRRRCERPEETAWEERLGELNSGLVVTEIPGQKTLRLELFCATRQEVETLRKRFGGSVTSLDTHNWAVPSDQKPILVKIRDRLLVTSERSPEAVETLAAAFPGRGILVIPPELAFGTGDHATTASCLRLLVDVMRGGSKSPRVLDLGTGTGILAIAAKKLGAGRVEAWECDPMAIEVALRNVQAHGYSGEDIALRTRDVLRWKPARSGWDLILANLFSEMLRTLFPKLRRALREDGHLIVSGMLASQAEETLGAARESGFEVTRTVKRGRWVSALCRCGNRVEGPPEI